jgi:peptidoglycan/LPS O-acetylase OafA/YrhL
MVQSGLVHSAEGMTPIRYRPEIDGLRAVAVAPVILFHAGFGLFAGGYVGVDVFFVISGFLITSILISDLENGSFGLLHFWERRARRILPALFLVLAFSTVAAMALMLPSDLERFSERLYAVATFWSNILFWKESGYFDTASQLKPLLHTWSLAVEEQYYLIFPILLALVWPLGRKRVLWIMIGLTIASLAASEWAARSAPAIGFYWLPFRSFELGIGVLIAFYRQHRNAPGTPVVRQIASAAGLALIALAVFLFDADTPFPGLHALVPTLGAGLIILTAEPGTFVHKLLSRRVPVDLGLISYSAYLWHQPLFAFARLAAGGELSDTLTVLLIVLSLGVAYLSWRFVEMPFRKKGVVSRINIVRFGTLTAAIFLSLGIAGRQTDGFRHLIVTYRVNAAEAARFKLISQSTDVDLEQTMFDDGACRIWRPQIAALKSPRFETCFSRYGRPIVVVGDSHGLNLYNAIARSGVARFVIGAVQPGCRPEAPKPKCRYDDLDRFFQRYGPKLGPVLFHQSGSYFIADDEGKVDSQRAFDAGRYHLKPENISIVAEYLSRRAAAYHLNVRWIGPFVEYRHEPLSAVFDPRFLNINPNSRTAFADLEPVIGSIVARFPNIRYFPFSSLYVLPDNAVEGQCFLFHDKDHLSRCAERLISRASAFRDFMAALVDTTHGTVYLSNSTQSPVSLPNQRARSAPERGP